MDFDALYHELSAPLTRRLERLVGDPRTAEDLRQETFARAWKSGPRDADHAHMRAWMHRTAHNLAIDELRRRRHRDWLPYDDELTPAHFDADPEERIAAREALARLTPHERLILLLRFEGGLSHAEIGQLLDIGEDAARKRVGRARAALAAAQRELGPRERPRVLILLGDDDADWYTRWIEDAGGDPKVVDRDRFERQMASADALVVTGSHTDVDPTLYGQRNVAARGDLDLERDRRDLAAVRLALAQDVPFVGICRGHQLLNIAFGGTLQQDIGPDHGPGHVWGEIEHDVTTAPRSTARRILGRAASVSSGHHQAAGRVGPGLHATSGSTDGIVESLEVPRHRFALGVQWHPERPAAGPAGTRLAEALVKAAA
jgi:RNA polymerase sigma factor (sigma-70 family)